MTVHACDGCLRRTWLVARLGGAIEIARHEKRALRELHALPAERLIAALGSRAGGDVAAELEHADPGDLRAAADARREPTMETSGGSARSGPPARRTSRPTGSDAAATKSTAGASRRSCRRAG